MTTSFLECLGFETFRSSLHIKDPHVKCVDDTLSYFTTKCFIMYFPFDTVILN